MFAPIIAFFFTLFPAIQVVMDGAWLPAGLLHLKVHLLGNRFHGDGRLPCSEAPMHVDRHAKMGSMGSCNPDAMGGDSTADIRSKAFFRLC